jgi:DNA-binding Xre family transcriptional regulator
MARAGMNVSNLADKSDISRNGLFAIRRGRNCKPATVGRIARALGCDVTEILETEDVVLPFTS